MPTVDFTRQLNEGSTTEDDVGTLTDEPEKAATGEESGKMGAKLTDNTGNEALPPALETETGWWAFLVQERGTP